ncbi:uncharacterized protein [Watersipora subatra]|uniref:uncharacterized protein n=1 Tax=Watersipora subatra TaxID=2589382 RepID=UPI00355C7C1D
MTGLKLYIADRDALPGCNVYTEMIRAMEKSRKIIIVLSNSFLRRPNCKGQADLAGRESYGRKDYQPNRILVVKREELDEQCITAPYNSLLTETSVKMHSSNEKKIKRSWERIRKFLAKPKYQYVATDLHSSQQNYSESTNDYEDELTDDISSFTESSPLLGRFSLIN